MCSTLRYARATRTGFHFFLKLNHLSILGLIAYSPAIDEDIKRVRQRKLVDVREKDVPVSRPSVVTEEDLLRHMNRVGRHMSYDEHRVLH